MGSMFKNAIINREIIYSSTMNCTLEEIYFTISTNFRENWPKSKCILFCLSEVYQMALFF